MRISRCWSRFFCSSIPKKMTSCPGESSKDVVLLACGSFNPVTFMHLRMFERAKDYLENVKGLNVVKGILSPVNNFYRTKVGKELADAKHRSRMLQLAVEESKWLTTDDWESNQSEWVPTVSVLNHTLDNLRRCCSSSSGLHAANSQHSNGLPNGPVPDATEDGTGDDRVSVYDNINLPASNSSQKNGSRDVNLARGSAVPRVMLLCGADLFESFKVPNLWLASDIEKIVRDFGLVVITRAGCNPEQFVHENDILAKYQRNIHIVTEWIRNEVSSTEIRRALARGESVKYLIPDNVIDFIFANRLYKTDSAAETKAKKLSRQFAVDAMRSELKLKMLEQQRRDSLSAAQQLAEQQTLSSCHSSPINPNIGLDLLPASPRREPPPPPKRRATEPQTVPAKSCSVQDLKSASSAAKISSRPQSVTPKESIIVGSARRPSTAALMEHPQDAPHPIDAKSASRRSSAADLVKPPTPYCARKQSLKLAMVRPSPEAEETVQAVCEECLLAELAEEQTPEEPSTSWHSPNAQQSSFARPSILRHRHADYPIEVEAVAGTSFPSVYVRQEDTVEPYYTRVDKLKQNHHDARERAQSTTPTIHISEAGPSSNAVGRAAQIIHLPHYATLGRSKSASRPISLHGEIMTMEEALQLLEGTTANGPMFLDKPSKIVKWLNGGKQGHGDSATASSSQQPWIPARQLDQSDKFRAASVPANLNASRSHSLNNLVAQVTRFKICESPETTV